MLRKLFIAAALGLSAGAGLPALAQDSPFSTSEEEAVRQLVREYILENPEIIEEAIYLLQTQRDVAEAQRKRNAINDNWDALVNDPRDFSIGPEDAKVTVVEFFDYNCGYCKTSANWVRDLIEEHGEDVRVVFKETPIFASRYAGSTEAAKAALAAKQQDKYLDLHFALMDARGTLDPQQVNAIAKQQGLSMRWLTNAMKDEALDTQLEETLELASTIGLRGTPYFLINGEPIEGANIQRLEAQINAALAE